MGRHGRKDKAEQESRAAVKQTLEGAALELEQGGWCQGRGYEDGKRCVTNAIGVAAMEVDELNWLELSAAATAKMHADLGITRHLAGWNDQPERTADEVISTLRRVASQL